MTDEEKKAVERLKNFGDSISCATYPPEAYIEMKEDIEDILYLIEKQSKKIEELKKPKYLFNSNTGEITRIDNTSDYISKDKIKAKVIEIKNRPVKDEFITATQGKLYTIIDIESFLDEEE